MVNFENLKVTNDVLWRGTICFVIIDLILISILSRFIKPDDLSKMKWRLVIVMFLFFCLLFGVMMSIVFWDSVYSYVFPVSMRWIIPPVYGILFALAGLFFRWLAFRLPTNAVINFCILGGLWGIITHTLAIFRGLLEKPPMLQGASPVAALAIAAFEFIFYFSACLVITALTGYIGKKLHHKN